MGRELTEEVGDEDGTDAGLHAFGHDRATGWQALPAKLGAQLMVRSGGGSESGSSLTSGFWPASSTGGRRCAVCCSGLPSAKQPMKAAAMTLDTRATRANFTRPPGAALFSNSPSLGGRVSPGIIEGLRTSHHTFTQAGDCAPL